MNSNLVLLNEEYKKYDYKKLYDEILQDETKEIDFLNYRSQLIITKYGLNIRTIEKIIEKYKRDICKIKQIEKFIKIYHFIKSSKIEVCVKVNQKEELDNNNDSSKSIFSSFTDMFFKSNTKEKSNSICSTEEKYLDT